MLAIDRRGSLLLAALLCAGCSGKNSESAATAKPPAPAAPLNGTPPQNLVTAYLNAQTALAGDDLKGAKVAFTSVRSASQPSDVGLSPELQKNIDEAATAGAAAADVAHARAAFVSLSDAMLAWMGTASNPLSTPLTVVHCPMANEGKGSKWLQRGDQVHNPYFGGEMQTCGDVEKTIAPGAKL
jgi:Cu(I)/Ag(I) efflux system membrane fusion protein